MKSYLFPTICLALTTLSVSAQDLADVLSSIQERKRAVEQSQQVADHLPSVDSQTVTINDQSLIEWTGLGTTEFPTTAQVDALGIDGKVALLNQAVMEFRNLQGLYVNIREEDLVSGEKIGVIRPFLPEDFPDLGQANSSNYHALLFALARDVRRLSVLPWPIGGFQRTKTYWLLNEEYEVFENGEMVGIDVDRDGTETVAAWQPSSLAGGDIDVNSDFWNFTYAWSGGAWGSYLSEQVDFYALSDSNHDEDEDYGEYDLRILDVSKDTVFHSQAALFSNVPGRNDQINGKVAVVIRNEWTPVDMAKVSVTAPNSWGPGDAGFDVVMVQTDPASTFSFGTEPDISVELDWVALGTPLEGPEDDWNDGIPFGYDATKTWLQGPADSNDPDWLIAWEKQQGIGPGGIAGARTTLFRRQLHGLCAPTFAKGLDETGKPANLEQAEKFAAPPAGDGQPVLHPAPDVLVGIPVGVGLDGSTSGFVGISPCEEDYAGDDGILYPRTSSERLVTRFDYAANLRFIGPAEDFHVVYATARDAAARGEELPDDGPTDQEAEDTGNVSFFDAWDTPRLRQVISRDLFIDITPMGHFKTQVRVFRRPQGAGAVDRTPGEIASVPAGAPIRTLVFENPDATTDPYPSTPEKVHVTDGTTIYKVWRDGYPDDSGNPDPALRFSLVGGSTEHFSKVITFPAVGEASIATTIDGNAAPLEEITDPYWYWHDGIVPELLDISTGGQTISVVKTFAVSTPGSQGWRYPTASAITFPDEPNVSLDWTDSGILESSVRGAWRTDYSIDAGALKAETKLNNNLIGTTWTEWSNADRTVRTYTAPDGNVGSKTATTADWSEIEFGNATGTGKPGLPDKLTRKDGSGTTWSWTIQGDDRTVTVSDGLLSGGSVTRGSKSVIVTNERGYVTSSETFLLQGGGEIKIAGSSTPAGQFSGWGAPLKALDYTSGLESIRAFDGQRERLGSSTDALGNVSSFTTYDALDRPTTYSWKGFGGTASYNSGGFGIATTLNIPGRTVSQSQSLDANGRTTGGSTTAGGTSSFTLAHAATGKTLTTTDSVTGATGTVKFRPDDGSVEDETATTLAFDGLDTDAPVVDGGLIKQKVFVDELTASFRTTWSDAWGRVRKVSVTGTDGANDDDSDYLYSNPDSTTKRVELQHASARRMIRETEPWAAGGIITRSGIDMNENGSLDAGDRYLTTTTEITGSVVRTTVTQTGNATALMVRDFDPSTGVTTTTVNGGEEIITETPNYTTKTTEITRKRGGVTVETTDVAFNHLGQADSTTTSGTGIATATLNPTFRDDGSVASFALTIGGATSSIGFKDDGTIDSITHPILGTFSTGAGTLTHSFAGGSETFTVDGTASVAALDGTSESLTGQGVMDRSRATVVNGSNLEEIISPTTGSATTLVSNAAGAKTGHDYAAGADRSGTWNAGGLLSTLSLGRGGSATFGYSADGARDLVSITWPSASSSGFAAQPFYGDTISLDRDDAGNLDSITDPSGERDLDYDKNRLTTTDWLNGELDDYKIVRAYDTLGRLDLVTIWRDGTAVHSWDSVYTGDSDELDGVTSGTFTADYTRNAGRHLTTITRGSLVQSWGRGTAGRITSAGVSGVTGTAPSFTYSAFDPKGRRKTVATNRGTWTYTYRGGDTGDGQLASATSTGNDLGNFVYTFDGIGRRTDFDSDPQIANGYDPLNQFGGMTHPQVAKNLYISADPDARVWFNGNEIDPAPADFDGFKAVPLGHPGSSGGWVQWTVKGVLEGEGDPGANPDAEAEFGGYAWFPPQSESFTYDADGNRETSALWDYGWDGRNRLVRAATRGRLTAGEGWDLSFDYDAEGRRFKKEVTRYASGQVVDHKVIYFVWDGWDLAFERHEDGNGNPLLTRSYVWGADISGSRGGVGGAGGLLLMRETRGQTTSEYYPIYDGTGHVVGLVDQNDDLVAEYWWGPFGELIEARGELAQTNPWRYATKYFDVETGLYYFGHRYYGPVTGQWLNRELLGEDESLNLYAYAHNDPINHVDVLGLAQVAIDKGGNLTGVGRVIKRMLVNGSVDAAVDLLYELQVGAELGSLEDELYRNPTPRTGAAFSEADLLQRTLGATTQAGLDTRGELRELWRKLGANAGFGYYDVGDMVPGSWDAAAASGSYRSFLPITWAGAVAGQETIAASRLSSERVWAPSAVASRAGFGIAEGLGALDAWTALSGNRVYFDDLSYWHQYETSTGDRMLSGALFLPVGKIAKPLGRPIRRIAGVVDDIPIGPGSPQKGGLNLFRYLDETSTRATGWKPGDRFLYLPNQGSYRANWKQNARRLRAEMRKGEPMFDSYRTPSGAQIRSGQTPTSGGRFLRAERELLEHRGWTYNPLTGAYHPPAIGF